MLCNRGLHEQSPEAIGTKFRHLVVNTSQTPYERSIKNNRTPISLVQKAYRLLDHLPGLPLDQPQFRAPPDSPLDGRTPLQSMMRCLRRPIGPHPRRPMPLFKWIHSLESETSTPSEEAHDKIRSQIFSAKIPICQSSHAHKSFTIMPMSGLYSCMSKHVNF
ncbi:hypothetical protein M9H77_12045 [Catharanthus roseus]|uniref:Uncharacterized protein n=1 Tax=Catharanthus roseus TaxID=4058 RepID=A0ACC0BGE1_CATRO|nr:hypothetical protein M9H77_12045 [Catharanthus roseus]